MFESKIETAINFIRAHEPPEGYFIGFSGGKDSIVIYDLVKRAEVKHQAYYSATGIDPPEIVRFIRQKYPEVIHVRPEHSFFWYINHGKGFPTRTRRWCCNLIKEQPTQKIPLAHRIMGIRAEESAKRAKKGQICNIKNRHQIHYHPIFDWLEWEVWEYIEKYSLLYPSLYDEGETRLGCITCPFIFYKNSVKLLRAKSKYPNYFKAFEHSLKRFWNEILLPSGEYGESFEIFLRRYYGGEKCKSIKNNIQKNIFHDKNRTKNNA